MCFGAVWQEEQTLVLPAGVWESHIYQEIHGRGCGRHGECFQQRWKASGCAEKQWQRQDNREEGWSCRDVSALQCKSSNAHREPLWADMLRRLFLNTAKGVCSMACPLAKLEAYYDSFKSAPQKCLSWLKIDFSSYNILYSWFPLPLCLPHLPHLPSQLDSRPFCLILENKQVPKE